MVARFRLCIGHLVSDYTGCSVGVGSFDVWVPLEQLTLVLACIEQIDAAFVLVGCVEIIDGGFDCLCCGSGLSLTNSRLIIF